MLWAAPKPSGYKQVECWWSTDWGLVGSREPVGFLTSSLGSGVLFWKGYSADVMEQSWSEVSHRHRKRIDWDASDIWGIVRLGKMSPDYECPDLSHILIDRPGTSVSLKLLFLWDDLLEKRKKKWKRLSRNSAASFGKRSHISLLVFRAGEKTNGWSPVIDFSEGWLRFCSVKCSIKQNFPPKVCGCVKSGK